MTTPPLFLADADRVRTAVPGGVIVLDGPEGRHAAAVRRIRAGETVDVADGAGLRCRCRVRSAERDRLQMDVLDVVREPRPDPWLVVVQALVKADAGVDAVRAMTEVGVDEIVPWTAARSVAVWRDADGGRPLERWRDAAREAAKQSRRARVPVVAAPATTAEVAERVARAAYAGVLHESASEAAATAPLPSAGEIVLVVGPEGGLTEDELAALTGSGAGAGGGAGGAGGAGGHPLRLGPSVLRSATAGTAAAAVVLARTGRWA